ncbi:MAG: gas vesicle protein K [Cytophagales bacterium]|nr:MAG: gas vesicle protein K [Cytophagales bacterium]
MITAEDFAKIPLPNIDADPENAANGLVQLVLSVVKLLKDVLEKQAIRRIENESLTEEQIERMGLTFMKMEEKIEELRLLFHLENVDLQLPIQVKEI